MPGRDACTESRFMKLSVIIATHNDEDYLSDLLERLTHQEVEEVIVADAGSTDATVAVARQFGANVARLPGATEGARLNAGVSMAQCELLWFLHAACQPPFDAASRILDVMEDGRYIGGGFRVVRQGDSLLARAGSTLTGFVHGMSVETGLFVSRTALYNIGGLREVDAPLQEAHRLLQGQGRLVLLRGAITVYTKDTDPPTPDQPDA